MSESKEQYVVMLFFFFFFFTRTGPTACRSRTMFTSLFISIFSHMSYRNRKSCRRLISWSRLRCTKRMHTWSTFKDAKALMSVSCFDFFQRNPAAVVQLQGDGDPAGHGGSGLGPPGRRANLRHLPQDQVRRWLREPVFVLPDQVLCPLWGASLPSIQHGKREKRGVTTTFSSAVYYVISW